jgi:LysW-gamma-L-alpha-aminoadipyl-6-phosphate/LysW-L-glutamyl-5-phosphate reductase
MSGQLELDQAEAAPRGTTRTAAIIGASGYTGGELLRLLLQHPHMEVIGATSRQYAGMPLHRSHPNLRGASPLRFVAPDAVPDADVTFVCLPHGKALDTMAQLHERGMHAIDLSADLRLRNGSAYAKWYGQEHARPDLLEKAIYGLPESRRPELAGARLISGVGCVATAMNLALLPLARAGLLHKSRIVVDAKIGSSAAGAEASDASMHAERSRSLRLYAPTGHRHAAEVAQECHLQPEQLHVSVHAVELVRGVLATCHILLPEAAPDEKELWRVYRRQYDGEPFARLVKERQGIHRGPDPKLVAGSNYADVGFHVEEGDGPGRIVATCAIDNLVKGAAGSAVQAMNVAVGYPESAGLQQLPFHPV